MASLTSSINLNENEDGGTGGSTKPKKVIAYKGTTTTGDATKDAAKYFEKGMKYINMSSFNVLLMVPFWAY